MNELRSNLRKEFQDKEYRHVYANESLNTYIATQIKVLREHNDLTQQKLAQLTGMAQPRIAVLEDINYTSWSISTLRRLAEAFDLRLVVRFEAFSSLIPEIEGFNRESLKRNSFKDDAWFHRSDAEPERSEIAQMISPPIEEQYDPSPFERKKVVSMSDWLTYSPRTKAGSVNAAVSGR